MTAPAPSSEARFFVGIRSADPAVVRALKRRFELEFGLAFETDGGEEGGVWLALKSPRKPDRLAGLRGHADRLEALHASEAAKSASLNVGYADALKIVVAERENSAFAVCLGEGVWGRIVTPADAAWRSPDALRFLDMLRTAEG